MLLLLNTSCFLFRVRETCNLTWFPFWHHILRRNFRPFRFRISNWSFLVFDNFCWNSETIILWLIFYRILRFGCFNKRTIPSMLQTWQMDSPFDERPRRPGFWSSLFPSSDFLFLSQTYARTNAMTKTSTSTTTKRAEPRASKIHDDQDLDVPRSPA